jgi:hypothetical protein
MQNGPPHIRVVAALSELWARELPWRPPRLLLLDALSFEGSRARALCKRGVKHRLKRHGEALAIVGRAPRKRDDCDRQNQSSRALSFPGATCATLAADLGNLRFAMFFVGDAIGG